jgi:hypothetical protein
LLSLLGYWSITVLGSNVPEGSTVDLFVTKNVSTPDEVEGEK